MRFIAKYAYIVCYNSETEHRIVKLEHEIHR